MQRVASEGSQGIKGVIPPPFSSHIIGEEEHREEAHRDPQKRALGPNSREGNEKHDVS